MTVQLDACPDRALKGSRLAESPLNRPIARIVPVVRVAPTAGLVGRYRALPAISGLSFLPISFLGRLPTTMAPLAILAFTASSTGSYAAAGLAATATAAGTALGAPLMGLAADRWGQRPVLLLAVTLNVLALLALALIPGLSRPGLLGLCALVGLSLPQVGGMARARWLALTRRHTDTAMAYEGTADEVAYVLGPAVAGLLASLWGAPAALLAAALTGLLGVGAFALHPTHAVTRRGHGTGRSQPTAEPNAAPPAERTADPNAEWTAQRTGEPSAGLFRLVLVPVLAMLLMGAFFAAVQSALTVYAGTVGHPAAGGLIYALMAVGSAGTALGTAALPACFGPGLRCAVSAFGLLLGVLTMATTIATSGPVPVLCAAVLFTGLSVGPILVTLNQVVGERAPVRRSATAMAYLSAGTMVGIALGATSAGALADTSGSLGAFAVAAAASTALLLLALTGLRRPRQ